MGQRHVLFLFLDGVGLGDADPGRNPLCLARMPTLAGLLGDDWYLKDRGRLVGKRASLAPTDACLGVPGRPQSATGQASLLTGRNVAAEVGGHWGPKPTPAIASILSDGTLFHHVLACGRTAVYLNPFPPRFFQAVSSGRRLLSAIPLAVRSAGLSLMTDDDLMSGRAVSPDYTGEGWRDRLGYAEMEVLSPAQAGARLAGLTQGSNLAMLEHWPTDLLGHRQDQAGAVAILERLDQVLIGLLEAWDWEQGHILITSDHGNLEDLSTRSHTLNPVPTIVIGPDHQSWTAQIASLVDIAPVVLRQLTGCKAPDRPESGRQSDRSRS